MLKEIVKFIPQIDRSALAKMEQTLGQRFGRVAKKFGKGLVTSLKSGAVMGAIGFIANKLLNPLKETQEAIDRALTSADNLSTNAKEFGTTAGKLFKLQALAKSTGLDEESLTQAIAKFQIKLAEAQADPTKQTSVRSFVGEKDVAEAFFQYVQGLQKLDPEQRKVAQTEVFGDARKQTKFFEFMQTDFAKKFKEIGARDSEAYTRSIEKVADVSNLAEGKAAKRMLEDQLVKGRIINAGMAEKMDKSERMKLEQENKRIQSYDALMQMDLQMQDMNNKMESFFLYITQQVPVLITMLQGFGDKLGRMAFNVAELLTKISKMSLSGGLRKLFGGGE
jgi:uncharacterized protein YidB (DUF937 family)